MRKNLRTSWTLPDCAIVRLSASETISAIRAAAPDSISFTAEGGKIDLIAEAPAADSGAKKIRRFSMIAYTGGPMNVTGFFDPVIVDLDGLDLGNSARPILMDHEQDLEHLLGQTDKIRIEGNKLHVVGKILGDSDTAKRAIALADNGFQFQASIGARVLSREYLNPGASAKVNGRTVNGPINIARKSVLGEVSFVILGADDRTSADIAANAAQKGKAMSFQEWLAAQGLSLDNLTPEQKTKLEERFNADIKAKAELEELRAKVAALPGAAAANVGKGKNKKRGSAAPPPSDDDDGDDDAASDRVTATAVLDEEAATAAMNDIRARRADDIKRMNALELIAANYKEKVEKIADLHAKAIDEGWSADRFELQCLRDSRKAPPVAAPGIIIGRDGTVNSDIIEAGICLSGKLANVEKHFDEKTLNAADKRFGRGLGLQEMLLECAWAHGYRGRSFKNDARNVLRYAFRYQDDLDIEASAISTINISGILSNTAKKYLLEGFNFVETAWREIATIRPVTDFKTITSYRMTGANQFVKVAPGGDIKHGTLGEESFTNAADTYGVMLGIDRRDLINDDLGVITSVPRAMGRGANLKLNEVFWTAFMDNSTFFTSGHSNYVTGATYVLGPAGLQKGVETFRKQVDADGKPLGAIPRILIVPPELETIADELFRSTNYNTGGSSTSAKVPNANTFAGKYRPIVSTYLSNSAFTGYSSTAWYLAADPNDIALMEVAFLNGQQTPTIETADADFRQLGIQMRGYWDFGAAKQDYRGGVKVTGA